MTLLLQNQLVCHLSVTLQLWHIKKPPSKSAVFGHPKGGLFLQISQSFVCHSGRQWNVAIANYSLLTTLGQYQLNEF
jgi:hypothetical protein